MAFLIKRARWRREKEEFEETRKVAQKRKQTNYSFDASEEGDEDVEKGAGSEKNEGRMNG